MHPRVVGEFDDSALVKAFGQAGAGVFAAPTAIEQEIESQYNVKCIGRTQEMTEHIYAITLERRIQHRGVAAISKMARGLLRQ